MLETFMDEKNEETKMMFGIELEYGGYDNRLQVKPDDIIETVKTDGSVAGDGREYNLCPREYETISNGTFAKEIETFMYRAANHNCTESATAGNHIHYSYNGKDMPGNGERIHEIMRVVRNAFSYQYIYSELNQKIECNTNIEQGKIITPRIKAYHDAIQWLYSISNRSGHEDYGLGGDYTRGYTRHGTIELRCWRTTLDYRSVIARVIVGWFFIKWALATEQAEQGKLENEVDWNELNIWNQMAKDEKVKNAYTYLAFHFNNKHWIGLKEDDLCAKLNTTVQMARAIKNRTRLYQKSLIQQNPEARTKELFKKINKGE